MTDGHRLHESRIEGRGVDPAGAFTIEVDSASNGRALVIDLAEVTFVDSSALKELLRAATELDRYETRFVLAAVPPAVQRLLDLTRTSELFTIAPDRAAAIRLVSG
jgi:anti-anti-sigma factor